MQNKNVLLDQDYIPLSEVPSLLPMRRGKKVAYLTVWRWATKGVRGRELDSVKVGRTRYTSREALTKFLGEDINDYQSRSEQEEIDAALAASGS